MFDQVWGIVWGGAFKSVIDQLNIMQKSILKCAFRKGFRHPSAALFLETRIFTVRQLYIKELLVIIYKNFNNFFSSISHNIWYAHSVSIATPMLNKTILTTNPFYTSHILYRNLFQFFHNINIFQLIYFNPHLCLRLKAASGNLYPS